MIVHTNTVCTELDCTEEPHHVVRNGKRVRMNTPLCERHAVEWCDARVKDQELRAY